MDTPAEQENAPPHPAWRELSHELRTPMAVIRMQAQVLLRAARKWDRLPPAERDRLTEGLTRIDEAVTRLSRIVERLDTAPTRARHPHEPTGRH